jgi:exodeoxyribonuclease V gamma subunit
VRPTVEGIAAQAALLLGTSGEPGSVDVNALIDDARFLRGTAPGVRGDVVGSVTYSRVSPRHRLAAWVRLLALTASHPQRPFEAVTIGKVRQGGDDSARVTVARIAPIEPAEATDVLRRLIDVYDRGMREALPIACLSSAAYAQAVRRGANGVKAASSAWESTWSFDREDREPDHLLVLGAQRTIAELLVVAPRSDERGWNDDSTRFGAYARRIWDDLLAHEELTDR